MQKEIYQIQKYPYSFEATTSNQLRRTIQDIIEITSLLTKKLHFIPSGLNRISSSCINLIQVAIKVLAHKNTVDKKSVTLLANSSRATEIKEKALERRVRCADNSAKETVRRALNKK